MRFLLLWSLQCYALGVLTGYGINRIVWVLTRRRKRSG
jgi:hypothetical protein